jgi:hypothetical protein
VGGRSGALGARKLRVYGPLVEKPRAMRVLYTHRGSPSTLRRNDGSWRPVRESNPCRRREREVNHYNSRKLSGMDSTLPH